MILNAKFERAAAVAACLLLLAAIGGPPVALGKLETWRQETSSAFVKGHRERVVVSETGRVRLGQSLSPIEKIEAARVWDLARTPDGTIYAATGDEGKLFRRESKESAAWNVAYDAADSQILAVDVLPDGHVFVGTGPTGLIVDVTDSANPVTTPRLDPDVKYIWDLAHDSKGNLYAATGPTGQLWKLAPDGKRTLILDSKHPHLLCVAVSPDGSVYAGSDGEGLIYRVSAEGKTSVVYDAPQSEIRSLLFAPDGALYAGTAAESGGGGGSGRGSSLFSPGGTAEATRPPGAINASSAPEPPKPSPSTTKSATPSSSSSTGGGSASPRSSSGDNAVYRIGSDSVPREVFRARALVYALAWQSGRLLVGTGPEGQLYEVRNQDETTPIARLDHGQILSMLSDPDGGLLIGAGDPGAVVRLNTGYVASGSLVSDVLDTKLISRFGALTWRADQPKGTSVALQVRTGNVGEPDSTWSAWSPEQTDPEGSQAQSPPGRFAQYRATLSTRDDSVTPELRSVFLRYQTANLPPEITKVEVPDVGVADGTTKQARLNLKWSVTDPNGDDLEYTLHIRKEGWPDWVRIGDERQTSSSYDWDTTAVPAGLYRIRITASDRPSNNPDDALVRERLSEPFIVDHDSPTITIAPQPRGATITLKDELTRLVKAAYALDGGDWVPVFPDDTLFDSPKETITVSLPDLKPGTHILVVRTTDAAGNSGTGDALIEVH
ncbi:WD40 repeat domain-containing protein [Singulisphaera sp. Ch08]|uniref:WD40 repeat domain-containing protein n=1 Tax=Singulisphaera sp. Ch08 TaxID=3120278 RepID=A0AAU7CEY3_9BACT